MAIGCCSERLSWSFSVVRDDALEFAHLTVVVEDCFSDWCSIIGGFDDSSEGNKFCSRNVELRPPERVTEVALIAASA